MKTSDLLSAAQSRAGRYLLRWGPSTLARKTGLPLSLIVRAEGTLEPRIVDQTTLARIRRVMTAAGVEFTDRGGVQLRLKP